MGFIFSFSLSFRTDIQLNKSMDEIGGSTKGVPENFKEIKEKLDFYNLKLFVLMEKRDMLARERIQIEGKLERTCVKFGKQHLLREIDVENNGSSIEKSIY